MSEARRTVDLRLAKGEITPEEHAKIIAALGDEPRVEPASVMPPRSATPPTTPLKPALKKFADMPPEIEKKFNRFCLAGGVCFGIWLFLLVARSNWLQQCRADPTMIAASCGFKTGSTLLFYFVFLGIAFCAIMAFATYKDWKDN